MNEEENNEINEPEEYEENSSSFHEETPQVNVKKEMLKKLAMKKIIIPIITNPIFWLVIAIIILLIFLACLISMDFDFGGTSFNSNKMKYYEPNCQNIYLVKQIINEDDDDDEKVTNPLDVDITDTDHFSYEEVSLDNFVIGMTWNIFNTAGNVNNEIVIQAVAISLRTNLLANLSNNCVVLKDNNNFNYVKLSGNEERYDLVSKAVSDSKGIIITKNDKPFTTYLSFFDYQKRKEDALEGEEFTYYMHEESDAEQLLIPSSWVVENVPNSLIKKVLGTSRNTTFSVYGAKYLTEKDGVTYTPERLLEYFFGKKIEYATINYAFSGEFNPLCSEINMNSTSLSKDDFIRLVNQDANNRSEKAKKLATYADKIYDISVANNINPELVVIRAAVEGYSPGESKNNYWGLGCTNTGGYDACISYDTIDEGIMGFINFVSKFSSLTELMSKYAYLGSYWYNPGSASVGGCYYAPYIFDTIPDYVEQACSSNISCTTNHESSCVATTDSDKEAYLRYQSQSMVRMRKNIFNLDADSCNSGYEIGIPGNGKCTIFSQSDPRWGYIKLGTSNTTMSSSGCAVTAIAIAMTCSGTTINNIAAFNPGTFVNRLNSTGGFTGANIYWNASAINYYAPNFKFVRSLNITGSEQQKIQTLGNLAHQPNTTLILHFVNAEHQRGHFVVLKSFNGPTITVYDPAGGKVNEYNINDLDGVRIYSY